VNPFVAPHTKHDIHVGKTYQMDSMKVDVSDSSRFKSSTYFLESVRSDPDQSVVGRRVTAFCRERALCRSYFFVWKKRLRKLAANKRNLESSICSVSKCLQTGKRF
jgi:hypothetical protein